MIEIPTLFYVVDGSVARTWPDSVSPSRVPAACDGFHGLPGTDVWPFWRTACRAGAERPSTVVVASALL